MSIYPNDLLHGDLNGVTTIPAEIAAEVADIGDEFVAAEAIILDTLRQGDTSVSKLREAQAESHAQIAKLRRQVSRANADGRTE